MSSTDIVTPNSRSMRSSSCSKASESRAPESNRFVSADGISRLRSLANHEVIRSRSVSALDIGNLLMLRGEQIEPEPVVHAAVDAMRLSLAADQPELQPFGHAHRLVVVDDPGMNRLEAELLETDGQHPGTRHAGLAATRVRLITDDNPDIGGLELFVDIAQRHDA